MPDFPGETLESHAGVYHNLGEGDTFSFQGLPIQKCGVFYLENQSNIQRTTHLTKILRISAILRQQIVGGLTLQMV